MHKYMVLRGNPVWIRRIIEDLQNVYLDYRNKDTGKQIGIIQLMPREVKTYEVVFPETAKPHIKDIINKAIAKHNTASGGVAVHWGPWKKDKYKDGAEIL